MIFCGRPRNRRPAPQRRNRGLSRVYQGPIKGPADRGRGLSGSGYRVVAFAGANVEPLAADANFDGVIILGAIVATRIVAEGVLVAGLFGDARIKFFE